MKVKELKFNEKPYGGWSSRVKIGDGIEMSIVAGQFAYSNPREDLSDPHQYTEYEVAVFKDGEFTREFYDQDYDDVLGWQTIEDIENLYTKIKSHVTEI